MEAKTVDIDALEAGPELDTRIAADVMGWVQVWFGAEWDSDETIKEPAGYFWSAVDPDQLAEHLESARRNAPYQSEEIDEDSVGFTHIEKHTRVEDWKPSTDIAAAMQVVEHLIKQGYTTALVCRDHDVWGGITFEADIKYQRGNSPTPFHHSSESGEYAASLAICKSALKVVSQ